MRLFKAIKNWYKRLENDPDWFTREEQRALAWSYIKWSLISAACMLIILIPLGIWALLTQQ